LVAAPVLEPLPTKQVKASGPTANAGVATVGCADPSPNAVIRLARVRDNPSTALTGNGWCGTATSHGTDYWPNALFDTREGVLQDVSLGNSVTLAGTMY